MALPNAEKLSHILGENSKMITTAARYVSACHKLRLSAVDKTEARSFLTCCTRFYFIIIIIFIFIYLFLFCIVLF